MTDYSNLVEHEHISKKKDVKGQRQVHEELERLSNAVQNLIELVENLEVKLSGVLGNEIPNDSKPEIEALPNMVTLAKGITDLETTKEYYTTEDILSRLEL